MGLAQLLTSDRLVKAKMYLTKKGEKVKSIPVQFNPSEYSISRSLRTSKKYALGKDQDLASSQAVCGELADLSLTLYFDTIQDKYGLTGVAGTALSLFSHKDQADNAADIANLLKYNDSEHVPLQVRFIWGKLDFMGIVGKTTIAYTMFEKSGKPIRAKIDLSIHGEETEILQKKKMRPFASPNRTKERTLTEGDQLWMLAQQEYDNPAMWKPIAKANDILNPRSLDGITALKVPSIK
ncbi:MAG: hypothetical protein RR573_00890 [Oscillospiraceae bacterium]